MSNLFDKIDDFESESMDDFKIESEKFDRMIRSSEQYLEKLMNDIKKSMRSQAKKSAKQFLDRHGL